MIDASFELNQSDSNSFGPPDTPQFSFVDYDPEALNLSEERLGNASGILPESFALQKESNPREEESAWSIAMVVAPPVASGENESQQGSEKMEDMDMRQRPITSMILSNSVHSYKVELLSSSKGEEASAEQKIEKEVRKDNIEDLEMKAKNKKSFILSNIIQKDLKVPDNLDQLSVSKKDAQQEGEENENTILEDAEPLEKQPEFQPIEEAHQIPIMRKDINESQSHEDKENHPVAVPQSLLPVIREENSGKSLQQSESHGQTINVNQSTFVQSSSSDPQQEQAPKRSARIAAKNTIAQTTTLSESLFWKIETVNEEEGGKRLRTKPCKFWMFESIRCLKNNQTIKRYRKSIEEVFLKLSDPSQILNANTISASESIMNGEITMKPRSKVRINQVGERIILSICSKQPGMSIIYEKDKLKIINSEESKRLVLNHPKIDALKNTLDHPCKISVKIYSEK